MNIIPNQASNPEFDGLSHDHQYKKIDNSSESLSHIELLIKKSGSLIDGENPSSKKAKLEHRVTKLPPSEMDTEFIVNGFNLSSSPTLVKVPKLAKQYHHTVNDEIVYQVMGGGVGTNSRLEGSSSRRILEYLTESKVFKDFVDPDLQSQLRESLVIAQNFKDPAFILAQVQSSVDHRSPLIIPMGWVGAPSGHGIYLKITYTTEGQANLRLYNVGAHDYGYPDNQKVKIPPYVDWINVPLENLTEPLTWKSLCEMQTQANDTDYGASDIYRSFKDLLNPEQVILPDNPEIFKTPQDLGNCSWKSLAMLLADHLSIQDYKKFMVEFGLEILGNFISSHPKPSILDWRLIQKSLMKLQYDTRQYQETYKEFPASIDEIQSTLNEAKNWLNHHKKVKLTHSNENLSHHRGKVFKISQPMPVQESASAQIKGVAPPKIDFDPFNLQKLANYVDGLELSCKNYQDALVDASLRAFLQKIDVNTFKEGLPKNQNDLEELSGLYEKLMIVAFRIFIEEPGLYNPDQGALVSKLLFIQQALVQAIYGKDWTFGNMVPLFLKPDDFLFKTPEEKTEEKVLTKSDNQDFTKCFTFSPRPEGGVPYLQCIFPNGLQEPDNFLKNVFKSKLLFKFETSQSEPRIKETASKGEQNAYFYSSAFMPPAIQSLRNMILYSRFLMCWKTPSHLLLKTDRSQDLILKFDILASKQKVQLNCSVEGLQQQAVKGEVDGFQLKLVKGNVNHKPVKTFGDLEINAMLRLPIKNEIEVFGRICSYPIYEKIASSNGWSLPKFLDHFYHHPTEIEQTGMQKLFSAKLFSSSEMALLDPQSPLFSHLMQWIETSYQMALVNNKIQTCLFLNRLLLQVGCYFSKDLKMQALRQLQDLKKKDLDAQGISSIYYEILYVFAHLDDLTEDQALELLQASAYLQRHPYKSDLNTPTIDKKVRATVYQHSASIEKLNLYQPQKGTVNHHILNLIVEETLALPPSNQTEWRVDTSSEYPIFYTDSIQYHPLTGEVRVESFAQPLPDDFHARYKDFQKIFPVQKDLRFNGMSYLFEDEKGATVQIYPLDEGYEIFQQIAGYRCRLMVQTEIKDFQGSLYLSSAYSSWQRLDDPAQIILKPKNHADPLFFMQLKPVPSEGQDIYELNAVLKIQSGQTLALRPTQFNRFEDKGFIHEYVSPSTPDELVELEFTRFGLVFTREDSQLMCQKFEGYRLVDRSIKSLGTYRNYLVIENDEGKTKVLIPSHAYQEPNAKEVLQPTYNFNRELSSLDQQDFYLFDFVDGELRSDDRESHLYLAATYQINQEYSKCQNKLREFQSNLTPFSVLETRNLQQIVDTKRITGDQSPLAIANSLKAAVILLKNQLFYQKNFKFESSKVAEVYARYLKKLRKVGAPFKLSSSEEMFLLKLIKPLPGSEFQLRMDSLRGHETPPVPKATQVVQSKTTIHKMSFLMMSDFPLYDEISYQAFKKNIEATLINTTQQTANFFHEEEFSYQVPKKDPDATLITRAKLTDNFIHFYAWAKDETADKKWLLTAINFTINSPHPKPNELEVALFLRDVINHPEQFPPPPETQSEQIGFRKSLSRDELFDTKKKQAIPYVLDYQKAFTQISSVEPFSIPLDFPPTISPIQTIEKDYFTLVESRLEEEQFPAYQAWLNEQSLQPSHSSIQKEWQRLQKDSEHFQATTITKALPKKTFEEQMTFQTVVQSEIVDLNFIIDKQKEYILDLANKGFGSAQEELGRTLWKESQKIKAISLEQLIVNFGQQRPEKLLELNPALTPDDLRLIYQEVGFFLTNSTESQRLVRLVNTLNQLTEDNFRTDEALLVELAEHLKPSSYDPKAHPALLTFEYFSNLKLRPAQIEKLNLFLEGNDTSFVAELIMGSGKSKVLLPLLSVLRAKKEDLSILILPESLYESIGQDTQNTLATMLGSSLHPFHFDSQTPLTIEYLEALLDEIHLAKDRQESLLCTEKSLSSLLLKFIELSYQPPTPVSSLLREILAFLTINGKPLIDEADSILNVTKELMFQMGNVKGVDFDELNLICAIYQILYTDPSLKSAFKLESDPDPDPTAPSLTPSLFKAQSAHIVKLIFQKIGQLEWSSPQKTQEIQTFFRRLIDEAGMMEDALSYVCRLEDSIEEGVEFYEKQSKTIKNLLALVGQEVSAFLPINLLRNHNEKYGFDKTGQNAFAIPYKSADTPALSSEFSNTHITLNYTIQSYLKEGIKKELLEDYLKNLQNKALKEMKAQDLKEASILKTQAWKEFQAFSEDLATPFFNYTEKDLNRLLNKINHSPRLIIDFVRNHVLASLETSEERMSSNPLLLTALFKQVSGLTGTLWNAGSLHSKLKAEKASGIESKTLFLLWKNSFDSVVEIKEGSAADMLAQLPSFDLLTDAGAYFKDESNAKMAELIGEKYQSGVKYYNDEGVIAQTDHNPSLTYLDQNHSVGADTKQKLAAVGLVTIGKEMLLRDLLQSVWRLRGLDKSQKVQLVVSQEIANLIRDALKLSGEAKISLKEIISYTVQNQVQRYKEDNVKALDLELDSLLQTQVLQLLLDENFANKYPKQVKKMIDRFWIQGMESSARKRYGNLPSEVSRKSYLKSQWKFYQREVKALAKLVPEEVSFNREALEKEIKQVIQRYEPNLPKTILEANSEFDDTVETTAVAYQEAETTTLSEVNINQFSQVDYPRLEGPLKSVEHFIPHEIARSKDFIPQFAFNSYLAAFDEHWDYSQEFEHIDITANMLLWEIRTASPKSYQFFGSHRVDPHFVLIQDNKMILLSDQEVALYKSDPALFHIGIGFCNQKQELTAEQKLQLVKIKFLKGEVRYGHEEINLLKKWLSSTKKRQLMETFFKENILAFSPEIRNDYQGSVLEKLLQEPILDE